MKKIYSYLLLSLFVLLASFSFSQGIAEIGSGTSTTSGRVMHTYYTDGRSQFTYTAAELSAAGVLPNADITSVAWNMQSGALGYPMNNANVKMSQQAGLPTTFVASPTTVWSGTYTILATGWQTITFSIPFTWDGVSNLVVEYCFDNVGYDAATYFYYTSMSGYTEYNYADGAVGCSLTDNASSYRLNAQFGYTNPITDYTWTGAAGDGNWNTAGNWDANAVPSSSDNCIIDVAPADISTGGNCANLTINAGAALNVLAGATINVSGNLSDVGGTGIVEGKIDVTGTVSITRGYTIAPGGELESDGNMTLSSGGYTFNNSGTIDCNATFNATGGSITQDANGNIEVSGTVTSFGTLNTNAGTVKYDGTSAQDVVAPSSGGYYNLTIENASTKTATGNIDVNGALTTEAEASCVLDLSTYDLNVAGNLTVGQEGGLDASDAACAVTFDGNSTVTHAGNQEITLSSSSADQTIIANTGSSTDWQYPINNLYEYSMCQTIIPSSEISSASDVTSINKIFLYVATSSTLTCNPVSIWMKNVGSTSAYTSYGSVSFSGYTEVLDDASLTFSSTGWYEIDITDFPYTGSGNIEILFENRTGSWTTSQVSFRDVSGSGVRRTQYCYSDGSMPTSYDNNSTYPIAMKFNVTTTTGSVTSINPTFNEIVVNGGDVTLADPVDVTTSLTLTSGDIITQTDVSPSTATNVLTIKEGGSVSGGSSSSHVVGALKRESALNATTELHFPLGNGTAYKPVYLTPEAGAATTFTAEFVNSAHSSIAYTGNGYNNTPCAAGVDHVANGCWWDIKNGGGANAFVAINWDANSGVDTPSDIVLSHWDGAEWEKVSGANDQSTLADGTGGAGSGTASGGRIKSENAQTSFSPFNLGSGSGGNNSLPIDLLSFHTECSHDIVDVNFSVVSQINNEKFLIERSTDAVDWEVVGELPGVPGGNSNTQMDYVFTDNNPLANLSYYRLTQVDFDGKAKTFYPVSSSCGSTVGGLPVDVYPNPAWSDVTIEFELDQYQGDDVYYTITDATGKTVMSDYLELNKGFNKNTLDINKLPRGVYILRFNQTKDHITETRIVKR